MVPGARGMRFYENGPRLNEYLAQFRTVLDGYDCMAVGEAAGVAAGIAWKQGIAPSQVDVQELRAELRNRGAIVDYPGEIS